MNKTGTGILVLNGSNTYNGGTGVATGILSIGANGSLGSGGAVIFGGGVLNLNGASNISSSLAAGHTVVVNANGALGVGSTGFTQSNLASLIDPSSSGVLGIDATGFNTPLTMTSIGNGAMSLGSTIGTSNTTGGVYTATRLTVPAGGTESGLPVTFGTTYRLGGGGGWLTITNNIIADQPGAGFNLGANPTNLLTQIVALGGGGGGNVYYSQVSNTRSGLNVGGGTANVGTNVSNGTVNFANNQSYTGVSAVNTNSTLSLDFSDNIVTPTANGTNVNILNSGNEVDLAGGGLTVIGNGSGASSQTLGNVKLLAGGTDTITAAQTGGGGMR